MYIHIFAPFMLRSFISIVWFLSRARVRFFSPLTHTLAFLSPSSFLVRSTKKLTIEIAYFGNKKNMCTHRNLKSFQRMRTYTFKDVTCCACVGKVEICKYVICWFGFVCNSANADTVQIGSLS